MGRRRRPRHGRRSRRAPRPSRRRGCDRDRPSRRARRALYTAEDLEGTAGCSSSDDARRVLLNLGLVPYGEAFELQRSLAGAVSQGAIPETVVFLEHPPVVTIGRRTETESELHIPDDAAVEIAETDRGGKSTFHGPGQLVCYPILDLAKARQGREALRARPRGGAHPNARGVRARRRALSRASPACGCRPPEGRGRARSRPSACTSSRWVTTHGYALNVDLDPAPFTEWITACGLEDAQFTTMARELDRSVTVEDVRPAAIEAIAEVFGLELEELPADDGAGSGAVDPRVARCDDRRHPPVPAARLGSTPGTACRSRRSVLSETTLRRAAPLHRARAITSTR